MGDVPVEPNSGGALGGHRRHGVGRQSAAERRRVLDALAVGQREGWAGRFTLMLGLSVVIGVMGLVANSAAVVIGAMLVAPLMTPVLGLAACLAMGWFRRGLRSAVVVLGSTIGVIVLAWVLARWVPNGGLTLEELARTSPGLADLLVALAAGTAGAYATVRTDVSSSLPGVAVAVALVPPLATVGITLEAGRTDLAAGALLLYSTNLVAIVLAGLAVFVLTGFVPPRRVAQVRSRFVLVVVVVGGAVAAVAVPLVAATGKAVAQARETRQVSTAAEGWLGGRALDITAVAVTDGKVRIDVAGPVEPPPTELLSSLLAASFGRPVSVDVRWTQRSIVPTQSAPPSSASAVIADETKLHDELEAAVRSWLAVTQPVSDFEVQTVVLKGSELTVDLVGSRSPPLVDPLTVAASTVAGRTVKVTVRWTQRVVVGSEPVVEALTRVRSAAQSWAASEVATEIASVQLSDTVLTVVVMGPQAPDPGPLSARLRAVVGPPVEVEILFVQRVRLLPSTTTAQSTTSARPSTTTSAVPVSASAPLPSTALPTASTKP